jgi:hypothetical protein
MHKVLLSILLATVISCLSLLLINTRLPPTSIDNLGPQKAAAQITRMASLQSVFIIKSPLSLAVNKDKTVSFSVYENPTYHMQIQYPSHWDKIELGSNGLIAEFNTPAKNDTGILENVVIRVEKLPSQNTSLKQLTTQQILSYKQQFSDFQLIASNPVKTLAGITASEIEYTHKSGIYTFHTLEFWTIRGSTEYMVLYNSDPADYSHYLSIIQRMFNSFIPKTSNIVDLLTHNKASL